MERIKIGIQKQGRLYEESCVLLRSCGLKLSQSKDQLLYRSHDMPVDILLLRDNDIPYLIHQEECDLGIVGRNLISELMEKENQFLSFQEIMPLSFSECKLCLAVPKDSGIKNVHELSNKKIATSHPALLKTFLKKNKIQASIVHLSGAVEIAPRLGIADAIFDLVSSGATLTANQLQPIATVLESEALLIQQKKSFPKEKKEIVDRLINRIRGTVQARNSKYIMLHAPKKAIKSIKAMIPGCESPTLIPLPNGGMVAFHAVCREDIFWDTMEEIKQAGAMSILILPIEKMLLRENETAKT